MIAHMLSARGVIATAALACSSGVTGLGGQSAAALVNTATLAIEVHVVNQAGDPITGLRPDHRPRNVHPGD
jgi:hypothetical protein